MRILLAIRHAYTDPLSGAARSVRTELQWLREQGHECRVLCSDEFDASRTNVRAHLEGLGVTIRRRALSSKLLGQLRGRTKSVAGWGYADFDLPEAAVTMLLSGGTPRLTVDQIESAHWSAHLETLLDEWAPDLLYTYGASPLNQEALRRARQRGIRTLVSVHNRGFEHPAWFEDAEYVVTTSPFLTRHYRERIGLESVPIESPIEWADVQAPEGHRAFVTFVNPLATKGAAVFARIADILSQERPDIPLLVVPSVAGPSGVQAFRIDLTRYPDIMVTPPVTRPRDFFEVTRILLVPSVIAEAFGRVAAEAMINGIPALVSNRGGLPETVEEGGFVIPVPDDVTEQTREAPAAEVVRPWVDTICRLWDDEDAYARARIAALAVADRKYSEASQKARYADLMDRVGRRVPLG